MKFLFFCLLMLFSGIYAVSQTPYLDSLQKVIETTQVDTVKGRTLCRLCNELRVTGNPKLGIEKGLQGLALTQKAEDEPGIAHCLRQIGNAYRSQGEYQKSFTYFQQCLSINEQLNDKAGLAATYAIIAANYYEPGHYPQALIYAQKSLQIYRKLKNLSGLANALNMLGNIHYSQNKLQGALANYQESLKYKEQLKDTLSIAVNLNNIGGVYYTLNDFPKAIDYYRKSIRLRETIGDKHGIAGGLINIGTVYLDTDSLDKALDYFNQSLSIQQEIGDLPGITLSQIDISDVYFQKGNYPLAKNYAQKALAASQKMEHIENISLSAKAMYRADSALGDWKSAFEYLFLYKKYYDSIRNEDKAHEMGRIESKYQFEQEAEEAKRKQAESLRLAQIETDRRNNLQYLFIFGGIITLFGLLPLLGRFRIPVRVLDIALFAGLLLFFEFLLILFDPLLDDFTGGIPVQKLVFNTMIALCYAPLHGFLEGKLRKRLAIREG